MLWLLFYWRLEKEKWFDQLILAIKELNKRKVDFEIFIFWKWSLESDLLKIDAKNVHFFGRKPLDEIKKYLPNIDYCLMPWEFLETFWLSALNALSRWLPVIWYKKWGLEPFIFQECNLFLAKWNTPTEKLVTMIEKLAKKTNPERIKDKELLEWKIQKLLPKYTEDAWYERFLNLIRLCSPLWKEGDHEVVEDFYSWNEKIPSAKAVSPLSKGEQIASEWHVDSLINKEARAENQRANLKSKIKTWAKSIFLSATPAEYELNLSDEVVEQIIRPTWLLDPITYVYPKSWDYSHLIASVDKLLKKKPQLEMYFSDKDSKKWEKDILKDLFEEEKSDF